MKQPTAKRLRIGILTSCYDPVINGVTKMVNLYQQTLTQLGHEVTIFTLGEQNEFDLDNRVVRSKGTAVGKTGYFFAPRYSGEAQRLLRQMDIVHCHHLAMSVEFAQRYVTCPIVYTNHTRNDLYAEAHSPFPSWLSDLAMRYQWPRRAGFADVVIAPSQGVKQIMEWFGVTNRIEVVCNGIDLTPFHAATSVSRREVGVSDVAVLFTYVGRLSPEKNLHKLLFQFAKASESNANIQLQLIGHGPSKAALKQQVAKLGIGEKVRFVGRVEPADLPRYLKSADCFITASISEVHPLTVIEAMAAGLPVIGIDVDGIRETVVHEETGLLAKTADTLHQKIIHIANNSSLRESMGKASKKASKQFDFANTLAQTLALYDELLSAQEHVVNDQSKPSKFKEKADVT